ncbi:hypothetical protein FSP39_019934 [Pinctada imbricata]|uniref:Uncharacterized protein n=1 Tax=Pinctada imbricata TaxID=66713 RepID=A0AA88Y779_PINIB|nr:hypothetical protein FSP39_019934 [Pinctada imbricata]
MNIQKFPNKPMLDTSEFMGDGEEDDMIRDMNRRGSNVSLSRFRSCPQLIDEDGSISNQAFESVADDSVKMNQNNRSRSPRVLRRFQLDQAAPPGSATPTPPSTPRSRRSFFSQKDSPSTPNHGLSPASTPRLMRKNHVFPASSRGSSFDSNRSVDDSKHVPLSEENLQKHDVIVKDGEKSQTKSDNSKKEGDQNVGPKLGHGHRAHLQHQPHGEELQNKCEMWLQTLNISQKDKIKSRSQIQLHPI